MKSFFGFLLILGLAAQNGQAQYNGLIVLSAGPNNHFIRLDYSNGNTADTGATSPGVNLVSLACSRDNNYEYWGWDDQQHLWYFVMSDAGGGQWNLSSTDLGQIAAPNGYTLVLSALAWNNGGTLYTIAYKNVTGGFEYHLASMHTDGTGLGIVGFRSVTTSASVIGMCPYSGSLAVVLGVQLWNVPINGSFWIKIAEPQDSIGNDIFPYYLAYAPPPGQQNALWYFIDSQAQYWYTSQNPPAKMTFGPTAEQPISAMCWGTGPN